MRPATAASRIDELRAAIQADKRAAADVNREIDEPPARRSEARLSKLCEALHLARTRVKTAEKNVGVLLGSTQ